MSIAAMRMRRGEQTDGLAASLLVIPRRYTDRVSRPSSYHEPILQPDPLARAPDARAAPAPPARHRGRPDGRAPGAGGVAAVARGGPGAHRRAGWRQCGKGATQDPPPHARTR